MTRAAPIERYSDLSGGRLCWFEWEGSGPTLLLLHATGFHARVWDQMVAALPNDWRVIAPDLRGHGRSYRPADISEWRLAAEDVVELVGSLDLGQFYLAGHSMGGFCAALLASRLPEQVAAALLIDPVVVAPEHYAMAGDNPLSNWHDHPVARRRNQWADAAEMRERFATRSPYDTWQAAVLRDYCDWGLAPAAGGEGLELACPPLLEASAYMGSVRYNPSTDLAAIRCPTTVMRARLGERANGMDFSTSPTWPELAAHIPGAQDLHWSEHSHFIPMEAPDRVADYLMGMASER